MGVAWVAQVRLLHLAILALAGVSCLFYVAYVTSPQLNTTPPPHHAPPPSPEAAARQAAAANGSSAEASSAAARNASAAPRADTTATSERAPPPRRPNATANSQPDLTRGVQAEIIYEAGHVDVSSQVCPELGKNIKLLIAITSAPSHESARTAIRESWGHYALRRDVAVAFMLGSVANETVNGNVEREQELYGDIIRGKFVDTYDNLTLKTISMLEWVDNYCPKAAFVLKTDDDMFINVARLLAFVARQKPEQRAIYGRLAKKWKPIRNRKSKYYISPQQYKPALFPDFTTGPAYLLPARISKELYVAALNHTYFKLEDVFVTGIVADGLKIRRIHVPEFLNKRVSLNQCSVQKGISIHMVKGVEQYDLWKKLHEVATKCKK